MKKGNVLVTGGGSGIGLAVCKLLAVDGYRVFAGYRNRMVPTEELSDEEKESIIPVKLDINDPEAAKRTVEEIEKK